MHSCIYQGHVQHRRLGPVENTFRYSIFFMYLDLAELPTLFDGYTFWSLERFNVATFTRGYHLGDPNVPLETAVRDLVAQETGRRSQGPIRLLTHLQYAGYRFNPVSFYYCYDQADTTLETIVAEVNNTPWKEQHCYVFTQEMNDHPAPEWRHYQIPKIFPVSPFIDMNVRHDFRFNVPGETLNVHISDFEDGKKFFDATLTLRRQEINSRTLAHVLLAYPLMTLKVTAMIHWQALRLWWKGAPFYGHPKKRNMYDDGVL